MSILGLIVLLIVLAALLPLIGVNLEPNIMRIVYVVLLIAVVVWLFTGGVTGLRV